MKNFKIFRALFVLAAVLAASFPAAAQDAGVGDECPDSEGSDYTYSSANDWDNDGAKDNAPDCPDACPFDPDPNFDLDLCVSDPELFDALFDYDRDGVWDTCDNCPIVANEEQGDLDWDGVGDACDNDSDNDGVLDVDDNCYVGDELTDLTRTLPVDTYNPLVDTDGDGTADAQADLDGDGVGDACDPDVDGDGLDNVVDPCPLEEGTEGEACNTDTDGDGVDDFTLTATGAERLDNCPTLANEDQADLDEDGVGDLCDNDVDDDGVLNVNDNCYLFNEEEGIFQDTPNPDQADGDRDRIGDVCDDDECFAVGGDTENCLDPNAEFAVYSPNVLDAYTGDDVMLRLFANREDAVLQYTWSLTKGPAFGDGVVNRQGTVTCSTSYEYHYKTDEEPIFSPEEAGVYTLKVTATTADGDEATYDEVTIVASGTDVSSSSTCTCDHVGRSGGLFGGLAVLSLLGLVLIRRRLSL